VADRQGGDDVTDGVDADPGAVGAEEEARAGPEEVAAAVVGGEVAAEQAAGVGQHTGAEVDAAAVDPRDDEAAVTGGERLRAIAGRAADLHAPLRRGVGVETDDEAVTALGDEGGVADDELAVQLAGE